MEFLVSNVSSFKRIFLNKILSIYKIDVWLIAPNSSLFYFVQRKHAFFDLSRRTEENNSNKFAKTTYKSLANFEFFFLDTVQQDEYHQCEQKGDVTKKNWT